MGIYDRDYYRRDPPGGGFGGGGGPSPRLAQLPMWSLNTWIIVINVAVFAIDRLIGPRLGYYPLAEWGYFSVDTAIHHMQLWRFVTFQFLHANFEHIFFNMLGLYFFGPYVERYLGSTRYLALYLISGVMGPIAYMALWASGLLITNAVVPLIGASAGVYGVVIALTTLAPNARAILLLFPVPLKLSTLAWFFIGYAVYRVLTHGPNAGGEAAHLGGMAAGWYLIKNVGLLNLLVGRRYNGAPRGGGRGGEGRGVRRPEAKMDQEVDRILDKVHREGLNSLTPRERQVLSEQSRRERSR